MSEQINPFQSPQAAAPAMPARRMGWYLSPRARGTWAIVFLSLVMLGRLMSMGSNYLQIELLLRVQDGIRVTHAEAASNDARHALVMLFDVCVSIGSAITFIMWFYRVNRNLAPLGNRYIEWNPGWTIGAWFIPIGN